MLTSLTRVEIIQVAPRQPDISFQDAPTVAELQTPIATAQDAKQPDSAEISLSRIAKAWAQSTNFYLEF